MILTGKMFGKYKLMNHLGSSSTGAVYGALQTGLDREVAIKVLSCDEAEDPVTLCNFREEASNGARYSHPNIATIYDSGEEDGYHYYVMELLKPESLKDLIERDGPQGIRASLKIIKDVLQALVYAHDRSITHGSLCPANVGFDYRGNGIVTHLGEKPEVEKSSDIAQAGTILYEMLTGKVTDDSSQTPVKEPSRFSDEIISELDDLVLQLTGQLAPDRILTAGEALKAVKKVELILDAKDATSGYSPNLTKVLPSTKGHIGNEQLSSIAFSDSFPLFKILAGSDYKKLSPKELFFNVALVIIPLFCSLILFILYLTGVLFPKAPPRLLEHVVYTESTEASIAWKASCPCYSSLEYYQEIGSKQRVYASSKAERQFKADLPNLTPDTTYHFRFTFASDYNRPDISTHSKEMEFKTKARVKFIAENTESYDREVIIRWSTNVATNTKVRIGENKNDQREIENPTLSAEKNHEICITGLKPATKYYYCIIATPIDSPAVENQSQDFSFETKTEGNTKEEAWRRKEIPESPITYLVESAGDKIKRMTEDERTGIQKKVNSFLGRELEALTTDRKHKILETKTDKDNFGDRLQTFKLWKTQLIENGLKPDMVKYEKIFGGTTDSYLRQINLVNSKKSFEKLNVYLATLGTLDPQLRE